MFYGEGDDGPPLACCEKVCVCRVWRGSAWCNASHWYDMDDRPNEYVESSFHAGLGLRELWVFAMIVSVELLEFGNGGETPSKRQ